MDTVNIPRHIAKARGLKMYMDSKPCVKGHIVSKWVTDSRCYICAKQRVNDRYWSDPRKAIMRSAAYSSRDDVKKRNAERMRKNRKENPSRYRAYDKTKYDKMMADPVLKLLEQLRCLTKAKKQYWKDPEKFKEYAKSRTAIPEVNRRNKERSKKYRENNPEVIRALNLKHNHKDRAARKKRLPKWLTSSDIKQMNTMYEIAKMLGVHVDHIIPLQGKNVSGLHVPSNLQLMLPSDNCAKKNKYEII